MLDWSFGEPEARRIQQPVLSVIDSESEALWVRFGETHRALCAWLTGAEASILPGATHFLQIENPRGMANALVDFFDRNRINA